MNKDKIHKNNEILNYEGKVEFSEELVSFYEKERKLKEKVRKEKSRHENLTPNLELDELHSKMNYGVEEEVLYNELVETLQKGLETLTDKQKQRFIMNKFENKSILQISNELGASSSSVSESITQAEKKLKKFLKTFN